MRKRPGTSDWVIHLAPKRIAPSKGIANRDCAETAVSRTWGQVAATLRIKSSAAMNNVGIHNRPHNENLFERSGNEYTNLPGQGRSSSHDKPAILGSRYAIPVYQP